MVVTVLIAFAVGHLMTVPLLVLKERMYLTSMFRDDGEEDSESAMSEVAEMQRYYSKMRFELNRAKTYLPQSVLGGAMTEEDDGEDEGDIESSHAGRGPPLTGAGAHRPSRKYSADNVSQSSKRSTASSGQKSSVAGAAAIVGAGLNTAEGLTQKRVTCSKATGCSFNAVTNVAAHKHRAAVAMCGALQEMAADPKLPKATAGLASGQALVGNIGTDTMRRFCVIGDVFGQAARLERLAKFYDVSNLTVTDHTSDLEAYMQFRPIDIVNLVKGAPKPQIVASLRSKGETEMNEWMYELADAERNDPFRNVTHGFESVINGHLQTAQTIVSDSQAQFIAADNITKNGAANYHGDTVHRALTTLERLIAQAQAGEPLGTRLGLYWDVM